MVFEKKTLGLRSIKSIRKIVSDGSFTEVLHQYTDILARDLLVTIRYDDPDICILWPLMPTHYALSAEDYAAPFVCDIGSFFTFEVDT